MGTHRVDRMWLLGGALAVLLLVVAGWFLLIHPKYSEAAGVRDQVGQKNDELITLNRRLSALNEQKKQLPALTAKLKAYQDALPTGVTDMTDFFRQLQDTGNAVKVDVSGITVGPPTPSIMLGSAEEQLISLTATGTAANLSKFLDRMQNVQGRAMLVTSVALSGGGGKLSGGGGDKLTASVSMKAFYVAQGAATANLTTD